MRQGIELVGGSCCVTISIFLYINIILQSRCEALSSHLSRVLARETQQESSDERSRPPTFGRQLASDPCRDAPDERNCARFLCQRLHARNSCKCFPIDELDRIPANDMRLRLTPANPHLREFVHDAQAHGTLPVSFATVLRQTCLSAEASHNVFVVDATATVRGIFTLQAS